VLVLVDDVALTKQKRCIVAETKFFAQDLGNEFCCKEWQATTNSWSHPTLDPANELINCILNRVMIEVIHTCNQYPTQSCMPS
jgi:hypothetical protein